MAHRQLLTGEERQALLGIPLDADSMARCFTLSRADRHLVAARRRDANRIGFAVQLALLRHPGIALAQLEQPVEPLVQWLAKQLEIPAAPFTGYARRPQTMTDHARLLAITPTFATGRTKSLKPLIFCGRWWLGRHHSAGCQSYFVTSVAVTLGGGCAGKLMFNRWSRMA